MSNNPEQEKNQKPEESGNDSMNGIISQANELETTLQTSFQPVKEDTLKLQKSLKTAVIIKSVLLLFAIIYTGWLFSQVRQINADSVMFTLRAQTLDSLPSMRQSMSAEIKAQAPQTLQEIRVSVLDMIPNLRRQLQQQLLAETEKMTDEIRLNTEAMFSEYVATHAETINKEKAGAPDIDKARELIEAMRSDFKVTMKLAIDEFLEEYSTDLSKLKKDLNKLSAGKNLTPKEEAQRKLLAAWSKLMHIKAHRIPPAHNLMEDFDE